jgi:hypothetical protein
MAADNSFIIVENKTNTDSNTVDNTVDNTCLTCWEPYTTTKRKKIICPKCNKSSCLICLKESVKNQGIYSVCPIFNCGYEWDDEFLLQHFPKSFVVGELRDSKKKAYFDREKTFIPEALGELARIKFRSKLNNELRKINTKNAKIREDVSRKYGPLIKELHDEFNRNLKKLHNEKDAEIKNKIIDASELSNNLWYFDNHNIPVEVIEDNIMNSANAKEYLRKKNLSQEVAIEKKSVYIYPCGQNDCNGFLNNKYVCGICSTTFCAACFGLIGNKTENKAEYKTARKDHQCKEEDIASAKTIKESTRPCPGCKTRIFKISGCDQMWCTVCHVAFSWRTGELEKGNIHNPEYTKYMSDLRKGNNLPTIPVCHNNPPQAHAIGAKLRRLKLTLSNQEKYFITRVLRLSAEINQYVLPPLRVNETKHKELRYRYIDKSIDTKTFMQSLNTLHRAESRNKKIHDYLDTFVKCTTDFSINLYESNSADCLDVFITSITETIIYINKHIKTCVENMGYTVYPVIYVNEHGYIAYLTNQKLIPKYTDKKIPKTVAL